MSRTAHTSADVDLDDDIDVFASTSVPLCDAIQSDDDFDPPSDDECPRRPIQHANTRRLREMLTANTAATKVRAVLERMEAVGLDLPIFLDLLSWGDDSCIQDAKIRYQRTALMFSEELPSILRRWRKPPRPKSSHDPRPRGARTTMESFAISCVMEMAEEELDGLAGFARCSDEELSTEGFTGLFIKDMVLKLSTPGFGGAPRLWALLKRLAQTSKQAEHNTEKKPDLVVLTIIMQLLFSRSHHNNRFAKFITTLLRSQNILAKSLDFLAALCITMSHRWSSRAIAKISSNEMKTARDLIKRLPFVIAYDNVNIPFRVFSQLIDNQSHFDSGTAATVFLQPNAPPEQPLCNRTLQEYRLAARQQPITLATIIDLETSAASSRQPRDIHRVLRYLFQSPEFDFDTYAGHDDAILMPPPPVHSLPSGREFITQQFMLGTVHMEEASYEGNSNLITEWLTQLGLNSTEEQLKTGLERIIAVVGDQLTVNRLRGLFRSRAQDLNSFDRLDWMLPIFGWFHLLMAFANSLHKQYLGSNSGRGLMHACSLLERKGLGTIQTRGPFHQNLHAIIHHVTEAHFRTCWKVAAQVENLSDLRTKTPLELYQLAESIIMRLASSDVVEHVDVQPEENRDELFRQSAMWLRDALRYIDLDEAIRTGDVGVMEQTLPHLLFRFAGGGNFKYMIEVLELLQCLHAEWPPAVGDFVRRRCWLINFTGRRNDYLPIDKGQEHNIKLCKVTFRVQGPNASWDNMKKVSPAIPTFTAIRKHAEAQVKSLNRGTSHTEPSKERDLGILDQSYTSSAVHVLQEGRRVRTAADRVVDVVSNGLIQLQLGNSISKWWYKRDQERATMETW